MEIKIVTWNMAWWSHKAHAKRAWEYLHNDLGADIALLTEMGDPKDEKRKCPYDFVKWQNIGLDKMYWGSGIVSKYSLGDCYEPKSIGSVGTLTTATLQIDGVSPITLVSMYCLKDDASGLYVPNLHRYLSDLTPILNKRRGNVIIGGDWNADLQLDGKNRNTKNAHRVFFDRLRDFGLKDCLEPHIQTEYPVQTYRHKSDPSKPWQLDHIYATERLASAVKHACVIDDDVVRDVSDHNPIEIVLDI
jgi:exonuclease III